MAKDLDLGGISFGRLTAHVVTEQRTRGGSRIWECRCVCGGVKLVPSDSLLVGRTQSCGCLWEEKRRTNGLGGVKDETGKVYGQVYVVSRAGRSGTPGKQMATWVCVCLVCGAEFVRAGGELRRGQKDHETPYQGCGCVRTESTAQRDVAKIVSSQEEVLRVGAKGELPTKAFELDVFVPNKRLAIEYDGGYWHSLPGAEKKDARKNRECEEGGISLLRISEAEWTKFPGRCKVLISLFLQHPRFVVDTLAAVAPDLREGPSGPAAMM